MKTSEMVIEIGQLIQRRGYNMEEAIAALEIVKASILEGYLTVWDTCS